VKVLVVGELNVDLVLHGYTAFPSPGTEVLVDDAELTLGSASAICAFGLARLGNEVAFVGKVGTDTWGDYSIQRLESIGIDTSRIIRDPALKTGVTVSISSPRDRALMTYLGATEALQADEIPDRYLTEFQHLHVSSFYLQRALRPGALDLFQRASASGLTVSLDPGFDPLEQWGTDIIDALQAVDVFFPNELELRHITGCGDRLQALRSLQNGRTLTVAKLGAIGCMALHSDHPVQLAPPRVRPLDTTGAGDSFNAGFLHAWLRLEPLENAMRFACACGAFSTKGLGGTGAQPTEQEARKIVSEVYR
jgi:sugar/nucleoside kinase (ribokinase family)